MSDDPKSVESEWGSVNVPTSVPTNQQAYWDHQYRVITFDKAHQISVLRYFLGSLLGVLIAECAFRLVLQESIFDRLLTVVIPIFTFLFGMGVKTETSTADGN
jgi:hypothetical protein